MTRRDYEDDSWAALSPPAWQAHQHRGLTVAKIRRQIEQTNADIEKTRRHLAGLIERWRQEDAR